MTATAIYLPHHKTLPLQHHKRGVSGDFTSLYLVSLVALGKYCVKTMREPPSKDRLVCPNWVPAGLPTLISAPLEPSGQQLVTTSLAQLFFWQPTGFTRVELKDTHCVGAQCVYHLISVLCLSCHHYLHGQNVVVFLIIIVIIALLNWAIHIVYMWEDQLMRTRLLLSR